MTALYIPSHIAPENRNEPALWFVFQNASVAVCTDADGPCLPRCIHVTQYGVEPQRTQYLGIYAGQHCYAVQLGESGPLPENWRFIGLREAFAVFDVELGALSGRAFQILEWDRNHQYCSRCGTPTLPRRDERSRSCPSCRLTTYPPISPAIMVLITDGGRRVLLARKSSWAPDRYSALAGFVEPGETLEDTVARETREEVGVEVRNIRYFGSQPWPFPHSLMIAFTAEYAGGEVRPDGVEIEEARWFDVDELPKLPPSISISRRLIDTITAELAAKPSQPGSTPFSMSAK
ncbi:MAG: diphosphatase [Betaproteobacteria bacterium]|jgi:NAD+ diphosphatase|nr:diphosphatase [Betaproteobacteria bacterium]